MTAFSSSIECVATRHLILNKAYQELLRKLQLHSFESVWRYRAGETIKRIKARSVVRIPIQAPGEKRVFFLKRHNLEFVGFRRLFAPIFPGRALSQGRREFENICDFRNQNLPTAIPVAAGERRVRFFWMESFLITEDYFPFISLEDLLKEQPHVFAGAEGQSRKRILIHEVARIARRMHQSGFNHLDFNATHILLHYETGSDTPKIALFDLQRVDRRKFLKFRWPIKSLARLNHTLPAEIFSDQDKAFIFRCYKGKNRLNAWDRLQWFWIKRKTARIQRHTAKMMIRRAARRRKGLLER